MPQEVTINVRVNSGALDLIDQAAAVEGKTRSAFLRDCAEREARKAFPALAGERCPLCGHTSL
jgi:uncharacterized protein (DUF1778 family)